MLRLDVAADETFRRDLLALCKTLMRASARIIRTQQKV
jgi:hypothetical protein